MLGQTLSSNFPTTAGVYDSSYNDASSYLRNDIVISKLSPGLDSLLAATYLGGTSEDNPSALALDSSGNVYVTGFTRSLDFPVINGNHDITFNGGPGDVFISKLSGVVTITCAPWCGPARDISMLRVRAVLRIIRPLWEPTTGRKAVAWMSS